MYKYILELFFFDDGHITRKFVSWGALIDFINSEVDLDDVFRLFVRVE